ncbi:MAG: hypothetical protein WC709_10620 [Thermoleophilia bacterium]
MRSRHATYVALAVVVAVALVVGVVAVAGAGSSTSLPALSAPELLARMGQAEDHRTAVSGEISWQNGLFGDLGAAVDMAQMPAQSPLLSSGSGRLWVSEAGLRVESQGAGGDQVVAVSTKARTAWVYDYAEDSVRRYVVSGDAPAAEPLPSPSAALLTPEAIAACLRRLAPSATLDVAGQATVAGREVYLLRFTPTAADTALGAVQASIDGQTLLPLRLEVFAKGGDAAVLRFGFDSVSSAAVDPALFELTPPVGAKVTTRTIDGNALRERARGEQAGGADGGVPTAAEKAAHEKLARRALLTREQVQALVPYELAWARGYEARPFRWGFVLDEGGPLTAAGEPLAQLMGMATGASAGSAGSAGPQEPAPTAPGPASILLFGDGLGTIVLAQTATTPELTKQLKQLPQVFATLTVGGAKAQVLGTPLGGAIVWQQGGTTLVASGVVPMGDLQAFASSVR